MDNTQEILDKLPGEINCFDLKITKEGDEYVVTYDNDFNTLHHGVGNDCLFSNNSILVAAQLTYNWLKNNNYV